MELEGQRASKMLAEYKEAMHEVKRIEEQPKKEKEKKP
jgi:hypothetical protein